MKVIAQLIRHFWERGVLTPDEVAYLLQHGFARRQDLPGFEFPTEVPPFDPGLESGSPPEPAGDLEIYEESLVRRHEARRSAHEPHPAELKIEEILERLQGEYARRATDLKSVLALGQRISPVKSWEEAAAELRSIPLDRFHGEFCAGLKDGHVLLGDVWQASEFEPFHHLISDEEVRGQAARAYLALLVVNNPGELGKHAWIMRYDETHMLMNLRVVFERVLASLSRIYQEDRHLLSRSLEANRDIVQVWSLVLIYNAHREPQLGEQPDYKVEYGPLSLPGDGVWKLAWTNALRMDRQAVSKFLVACYDESERAELERDESCRRALMCPVGWHIPDETP
jgi:hypothetical protein